MNRILSIDFGLKRIGLAVSDPMGVIATGLPTLLAERTYAKTAEKLLAFIDQLAKEGKLISKIVIGMPYKLNGQKGLQADEVMHFIEELKKRSSLEVITWDERLTSMQATRVLKDAGLTRKKQSQHIDNLSAVIILQNYLDANGKPYGNFHS